jgi:hypothetical protein
MSTKRYILLQKDLLFAKKLLSLNYEVCGNFRLKSNNILHLDISDEGEPIRQGERGSCISTNVWMNWHTHPYMVLPWPSTEDIFKILFDRKDDPILWGSLIFTEWGVWEIYSTQKDSVSNIQEGEEEWTQYTSDALYSDLGLDNDIPVPSINESKPYIINYIRKWKERFNYLGLEITLTDWNSISKDYVFKTGLATVKPPLIK